MLVLNASPGEFESGLAGQTLEDIWICRCLGVSQVSLYKIFVHVEAVVHESTIFYPLRPPALPTLVQYYCTTFGQYTTPVPTSRLYAIHHTIMVITIWCKG